MLIAISIVFIVSCCTYKPTVRAYNKASAGSSAGCGVGGGSLYQSFLASHPRIESISLLLATGGSFPSTGYTTHLQLRDCFINGSLLSEAYVTVPGPILAGKQINVLFTLPHPVSIEVGRRCIIQWTTPPEGDSILTWMYSTGNTYPDGNAFGCNGTAIQDNDYIFQVMPLD